jgi:hypothetical protein
MVKKQTSPKPRYASNIFVGLLVLTGAVMVMIVIINKMAEVLG